jgi:hypothetical protein
MPCIHPNRANYYANFKHILRVVTINGTILTALHWFLPDSIGQQKTRQARQLAGFWTLLHHTGC